MRLFTDGEWFLLMEANYQSGMNYLQSCHDNASPPHSPSSSSASRPIASMLPTIADAEIARLVQLATRAPTAYNLQNWRFIAVRTPQPRPGCAP
jgi:hypothetical protein